MATAVLGTYSDYQCTRPGLQFQPGAAAFLGSLSQATGWGSVNGILNKLSIDPTEVVLSGGTTIYDFKIPYNLPDRTSTDTDFDYESNVSGRKIWNINFLNIDEEQDLSIALSISTEPEPFQFIIGLYVYNQSVWGVPKADRTAWGYSELIVFGGMQVYDTAYSALKLYRGTIEENEYYVFALNVKPNNETSASETRLVAIPIEMWGGRIPEPYVGPVSEESVEASFVPTEERHDEIEVRVLTEQQRSGYGLYSSGSGYKLLIPNTQDPGAGLTYDSLLPYIFGNIFRGSSEGLVAGIEQSISGAFGGNNHRPADEVKAMVDAIVCCHSVPVLRDGYSSYVERWTGLGSLGGYPFNLHQYATNYYDPDTQSADYALLIRKMDNMGCASHNIFEWNSGASEVIIPRLHCFLDYEPYTHIVLKLPFFQPITVPTNLIYDSYVKVHYCIDIATGLLICDVFLGKTFYTTLSTNVKTDIPIIGQGANGGGLSKISAAVGGMISSFGGNEIQIGMQAVNSGIQAADAISRFNTGVVVGKEGNANLAPLLAPRTAYLLITHPKAAIPAAEEDGKIKGTFLNQVGMAANLGYKINQCAGGWNKFSSVDLSQVQAPQAIKEDILARLKEGVYIE